MMYRMIACLLLTSVLLVDVAEARWFRRSANVARSYHPHSYPTSRSSRSYTPRPATGYGANIHRNFILKQELRRAASGATVRPRGNILWYR